MMLLNIVHENIGYLLMMNFINAGIFDSGKKDVVVI